MHYPGKRLKKIIVYLHSIMGGETQFGRVAQITQKAGEVHVTCVLHTPLQPR